MEEMRELAGEFIACKDILTALGDESRQQLILAMMQMGRPSGVRVGEIADKTGFSRVAVSHHLQVLKDAGVVRMRREGTRNYYYFDIDRQAMNQLLKMLVHARGILEALPDRSGAKRGACR